MFPLYLALLSPAADPAPALDQPANTWVKRSPLVGGPPSPGLGYECSLVWDPKNRRVIRWAGHNQGGGGEQNAETWAFDPLTGKWELKEPNTSPPGACCNNQNVFDLHQNRFLRFPAFSGSHGWQWFREIYLSNSTVWNYDLGTNTWRDRRPLPAPRVAPLRCASWDGEFQVAVVFGGEGSNEGTLVYDPYTNTWHRVGGKLQPPPRSGGNLVYDAAAKKHILFGTQFGEDRHTWAFDLRKNEWTDLKPATMPPTDRNDPVMAYDPISRRVIAVVRAIDRQNGDEVAAGHVETWAFDTAANTWTKLNPPKEPDGWGNRRRVMISLPELNAVLMEAYVNPTDRAPGVDREQQIWTYRFAAAKPSDGVQPPAYLRAYAGKNASALLWAAVSGASGYVIYRGFGETPWSAEFKPIGKPGPDRVGFADKELEVPRGKVPYYRIAALDKDGKESEPSPVVRAQPRVAEDVTTEAKATKEVVVSWTTVPTAVGYHVERAPVEVFSDDQILRLKKDTPPLNDPAVGAIKKIGKFQRLTKEPVKDLRFADTTIELSKLTVVDGEPVYTHRFRDDQLDPKGKPYPFGVYAYRVVAVNALGAEGGPSAWVLTIPPAVEHVFAREEGEKCHLKWKAVPGAAGYRVYRMEGPKINGPGQPVTRLTPEPVKGTTFTDEKATKDTKRYWVVAVDALGQEGIPSAPAWHWRQFRKFYEPFTGDWHQ